MLHTTVEHHIILQNREIGVVCKTLHFTIRSELLLSLENIIQNTRFTSSNGCIVASQAVIRFLETLFTLRVVVTQCARNGGASQAMMHVNDS